MTLSLANIEQVQEREKETTAHQRPTIIFIANI
jgi:hypothetical protein